MKDAMGKVGDGRDRPRTFFGRLARDVRGNTLAIMAAALFPLTAMIGSGVDMTRAYMAQNRFRQACDAGSLAGRRLLSGTNVTSDLRAETTKYFQFNFPQGQFQTAAYTLAITAPTTGTLHVESSTTVPTTIMKMFGFTTLPITASCSATQDFVNTDIMMVFDLSGSMNCAPGVAGACGEVEQTGSKIDSLRDAATSLYDTLQSAQDQLHNNNLRLRYGFINYNSTVNVGRFLYARNNNWMVQNWNYQTRLPNWVDATGYFGSKAQCDAAYTYSASASSVDASYTAILGGWWTPTNRCMVVVTTKSNPDGYTYMQRSIDVRSYLASNPLTGATIPARLYMDIATTDPSKTKDGGTAGAYTMSTWNGCIEERQTNNSAINGGTATAAPSDAYDLDVDLIPSSDATRWRPMLADLEFNSDSYQGSLGKQPGNYCPTEARRLTEYYNNRSGFVSYLNSLVARGGTYHDLGMIWGARFISPTGIFASSTPDTNNQNDPDNPSKIRGFSVKKYMIFMTDGDMAPTWNAYSAYGMEYLDGRVMGSPSTDNNALLQRHLQRFRMACNAAKSKGIDIWVIAFSTTLTSDMQNCASKPEQASGLSTQAQLIAKFQEIGSKIGALRLSQ